MPENDHDPNLDPQTPMGGAVAAGALQRQADGSYVAYCDPIPPPEHDYRDALYQPPAITPEDRAVWLGLQLENARLQHEVERLQDELAALRLAQPLADVLTRELPRIVDKLQEAPDA